MGRWNGKTRERGYGSDHQAIRKQRIAIHRPGNPCAIGGEPLWQPPELLDVPHDHVNGGYLPGLSCRTHNRAEGAARGNQIRGFTLAAATPKGAKVTCKTCGRPYTRAARSCEICAAHYHPTYGEQRTCSRACGVQLVRRNKMARGWIPKAQRPRPPRRKRQPAEPYAPRSTVVYYTCRYCGCPGAASAKGQLREVCNNRSCQLARLKANNLHIRSGVSKDDADAHMTAVVTGVPYVAEFGLIAPARSHWHACPGCGEFTAAHRWCDACLCTTVNAKGKRCGNVASVSGQCDYHASVPMTASRQW